MSNRLSILIVDDDAPLRSAVRALIRAEPTLRVAGEAGDGETAVRLAAELGPDVVLMDLWMPGEVDGLEATRRIVAAGGASGPQVIALSSADESERAAVAAGAIGFISKGRALGLIAAIQSAVAGRRR